MTQDSKDQSRVEAEAIAISLSKGSTFLYFGRFLFYIIGFIGFAIVARLILREYGNAEPLGWIYVASIIPSIVSILSDFGVGYGIMNKFIIQWNKGEKEKAYKIFWTGSTYNLFLNSFYAIIVYLVGTFIINYFFQKPEASFLIPIYSAGVIVSWIYNLAWKGGIMIDKVWINGIMLILQMLIQYGFAILFLLSGYGIWGVAFSASILAPLFSGILGSFLILNKIPFRFPSIEILKESLKFGFPVYSGSLINSAQDNVFNALISRFASSLELGYYYVAQRLSPIISLLTYPLDTLMFPMFSKVSSNANTSLFFQKLIKLYALLTFLGSFIILSMPGNLLAIFFGQDYSAAYLFAILLSIYWIETGLGGSVSRNLLMGQGKTKLVFNLSLLGSLFTLLLGLFLIPFYGIIGSLISSIIGFWPPFILSLKYVKKEFEAIYPIKDVFKAMIIGIFTALISYTISNLTFLGFLTKTILAAFFGFMFYIYFIKKSKLITEFEFEILDNSFSKLPFIGNFLKNLLQIYKRF
jgi:O-antigen/teichoic acid export membrane protein